MHGSLKTLLVAGALQFFYLGDMAIDKRPETIFQLEDANQKEVKLFNFEKSYEHLKDNWDYFDKQILLVKNLIFLDTLMVTTTNSNKKDIAVAAAQPPDTVILVYTDPLTIAHELAHMWYYNLTKRDILDKKWEALYGKFLNSENSLENLIEHGSVTYHALKNIREDIAETAGLVYALNDPNYIVKGFPAEAPDFRTKGDTSFLNYYSVVHNPPLRVMKSEHFARKLTQKIQLLTEYGFFSKREAQHAIRRVGDFQKKNQCIYE